MIRYLAIACVALATVPALALAPARAGGKAEPDIKIQDKLTGDDARDKVRGAASKVHVVKMKAGNLYTIDMMTREFDSFLRLEDKDGKELDQDDDSGGELNARILFNCSKDGDYRVICTAYDPKGVGNYTLTVKSSAGPPRVAGVHEKMLGKLAPDFHGDWAVNGKVATLADLKGKVVILSFWSVVSGDSVAALPKLSELHTKYQKAGLAVVGVSYYGSEIGQKLGFDKTAGRITQLDVATKETDQALLADFAAHHKLDHLLLTLSKEEALQAFDTYGVNGVPHFVLIDRKGLVRLIRVGDLDRDAAGLEKEIKKLLAEK